MRIPRIYTPQQLICGEIIELDPQASNHISRVLRLKPGHQVKLFNGLGGEYLAEITTVDKKSICLSVTSHKPDNKQSCINTHIAVAVSKGDKMDLIIQKCTELGVSSISPIISERSDVKLNHERWQKKFKHWQSVSISACEQSGRNLLPEINEVQSFSSWVNNCPAGERCIFHPTAENTLESIQQDSNYLMCFGSEGGFTENEITEARSANFKVIGLGARVLRAETAPLAVLAIIQSRWGDIG